MGMFLRFHPPPPSLRLIKSSTSSSFMLQPVFTADFLPSCSSLVSLPARRVVPVGSQFVHWLIMVSRYQSPPFVMHYVSAMAGILSVCHPIVFVARSSRMSMRSAAQQVVCLPSATTSCVIFSDPFSLISALMSLSSQVYSP